MGDINRKPVKVIVPIKDTVGVWVSNVAVTADPKERAFAISQMNNLGREAKRMLSLVVDEQGKFFLHYLTVGGVLKTAEVSESAFTEAILRMLVGLRDSVKEVMGVVKLTVETPLRAEPKEIITPDEDTPLEEEQLELARAAGQAD